MRDYLAYLLRRFRTAWTGEFMCPAHRCGRARSFSSTFCGLHRL
jgi:hypothetical protein